MFFAVVSSRVGAKSLGLYLKTYMILGIFNYPPLSSSRS